MTTEDAQMVPAPLGPVERVLGRWFSGARLVEGKGVL